MKSRISFITPALALMALMTTLMLSACNSDVDKADELTQAQEAITKSFAASNASVEIVSIKPSPLPGVYEVRLQGHGIIYMDATGSYLLDGNLLQVVDGDLVNVTEKSMAVVRKELLAGVKDEDTITFSPEAETKATITVFTDVDCGYCQKLHKEVPALNKMGIAVRYLAYPRAGIGSPSYIKIASAWCADDRQDALTKLKNRQTIATNVCPGNPVQSEFMLGQEMGVTGTPAIVMESGEIIRGYMPADHLAKRLGI